LPLVAYNNSVNKVQSNSLVENVNNLESYEYLEPEFQILLENNFECIKYYNIADNDINESVDSNQSEKIQNI